MINFTYQACFNETGPAETDREWCWFRGDGFITWTQGGEPQGEIPIPEGATVVEAKAAIRRHAKGGRE